MLKVARGGKYMSWEDWFGFSHDPFDPKPLQTEEQFRDLLVKTKPITERIEPLINQINQETFCKGVLGSRGIGKSTVLRYCEYLAAKKGAIPVFVQFHPAGIAKARVPAYETLIEIMTQIVQREIINIYEMYPKTFQKYQSTLMKTAKYVGLQWQEIEGFYRDPFATPPPNEKLLRNILWSILEFTKQDHIRSLIMVDNLDKLPFEVAKGFLGGMMAQPLFEHLMEAGCSIFVAIDPRIEERIRVESDLSYLGERIELVSLSPNEAAKLLRDRIKNECGSLEKAKLIQVEDELITRVCNEKKGNTREILKEFSKLFQAAYERKERHLSTDLYEKQAPKISSTIYYGMIEQNTEVKKGAEKILSLVPELTIEEVSKARDFLVELYKGRQISVAPKILERLYDGGVIVSTKKPSTFQLHPEVYELFRESSSIDIEPVDLASWLMRKDIITTVKTRYPTFKSKRLIKRALEIQANSKRKTGKVTLFLDADPRAKSVQWPFAEYYDKSVRFLETARAYYESFELQAWEDANAIDAQNLVYFTMLNFLLSFSYYYILFAKTPFRATEQKYWPLIFSVLRNIQKKTTLKSFPLIFQVRQKQYNMKNGRFHPTLDDINRELLILEDILVDLLKIWETISEPHILHDKNLTQKIEKVQEKLIEIANENGWPSIQADENFHLIVGRTQDLAGRKKRPQFLLVKTKVASPPQDRDFLEFFSKAEGIIGKYEQDEYSKDFLKPAYHLWFVSTAGFKKLPRAPKMPAPRNRINIKYLHEEDLEICFKKLNLMEFLDLDSSLLETTDIEKFQEFQEFFFMESPEKAASDAFDYFEKKMRTIVKETFEHHFGDEWYSTSTVPMKAEIEKRLEEEKAAVPKGIKFKKNPLEYTYISDIRDVVLKKDNWKECFGILFNKNDKLRAQFRTRIDEIQDLRNKIKHAHEKVAFTYTDAEIRRVLQNMVWILSYSNQYKTVIDFFDQDKPINIETRDEGKIVKLGRVSSKISKSDAEEFDRKVKEVAGRDVYKTGGNIILQLENLEKQFNLPRKKVLLMLALCKESGIAAIYRQKFNQYKIHFRSGN